MNDAVEERKAAAAVAAPLSTAPSLRMVAAAASAITVAPLVPQQPQNILVTQSVERPAEPLVDGTYGLNDFFFLMTMIDRGDDGGDDDNWMMMTTMG